jgi:hypothetical protein
LDGVKIIQENYSVLLVILLAVCHKRLFSVRVKIRYRRPMPPETVLAIFFRCNRLCFAGRTSFLARGADAIGTTLDAGAEAFVAAAHTPHARHSLLFLENTFFRRCFSGSFSPAVSTCGHAKDSLPDSRKNLLPFPFSILILLFAVCDLFQNNS